MLRFVFLEKHFKAATQQQTPGFFLTKNVVIFTENIVKKRKLPTSWKKNNKKSGLTEEKTENAQLSGKSGVFLSIDWKELTVVC